MEILKKILEKKNYYKKFESKSVLDFNFIKRFRTKSPINFCGSYNSFYLDFSGSDLFVLNFKKKQKQK